jgi:hypothetical protein
MADVIDFLERMGQDAALRHASEAVLEQAMRDAQMAPRQRAALLSGDRAEIEAAIGADGNVCCAVFAPEQEEKESQEPRRPKAVLGVDNKVCCMINAPLPDAEEKTSQPGQQKAVFGVDENVCCMIYAPTPEGDRESAGDKLPKAA